jgi:hypothetical protein
MLSPARARLATLLSAMTVATSGWAPPASADEPPARGPDDTAEACFAAAERAQPLLRQKKLREARAVLEVCARDVCPRVARTDCREWLAEATDAQPSMVIAPHEIRGVGATRVVRNLDAVRATIDENLVVDHVDATPILVDPGRHRLRLERTGADPIVQDVDIAEGDKGHIVDVYWHVAETVTPPSRPIPPAFWVAGALGVAAAGTGTYFEISGLSRRSDLNSCKPTCPQSQVDSARTQVRTGDLTLGAGILLLAGALIVYVARPTVEPIDARRSPSDTAWVGLVPGGFVAGAQGSL